MSTRYPDLFAALAAPFDGRAVKTRQAKGAIVSFVTARVVANRLDDVLGPENWRDEYQPRGDDCMSCRLSIRLPDGEWLAKEDVGGCPVILDKNGEVVYQDDCRRAKSACSDSFKRAAAKWGVGRYLYRDGVPSYATVVPKDDTSVPPSSPSNDRALDGRDDLPSQARPPSTPEPDRCRPPMPDADRLRSHPGRGYTPGHGRELAAWARKQDAALGVQCFRWLAEWGRRRGYPDRLVDWSGDQVQQGYAAATAKLRAREQEQEVPS